MRVRDIKVMDYRVSSFSLRFLKYIILEEKEVPCPIPFRR
jgi:hypothetical protein